MNDLKDLDEDKEDKLPSKWVKCRIFYNYIYVVLKQVHPELRISKLSIYLLLSIHLLMIYYIE